MKIFDYCVSNPPYQENNTKTSPLNIYPFFIILGEKIATHSIMIHPNRAFKGASRSDKKTIEKIKNNTTIRVLYDTPKSQDIFTTVDIRGGIMISITNTTNPQYPLIGNCIPHTLQNIKNKTINYDSITTIIQPNLYRILVNDNKITLKTNIFNTLDIFTTKNNNTTPILGRENNNRIIKYIDNNKLNNPGNDKWKVFLPSAGGKGEKGIIGKPQLGKPGEICTTTFIIFGYFDTFNQAYNCEQYLKTKFCRALLSIKKITQHNTKKTWEHVPLLDFNYSYDDKKLYNMFHLNKEEIQWIENNIQEMD